MTVFLVHNAFAMRGWRFCCPCLWLRRFLPRISFRIAAPNLAFG